MDVAKEIFKAYDIRGTYPDQLSGDIAYAIGRSACAVIAPQSKRPRIVVGMDARLSGPELRSAFIRGLTESGADVTDIGLVSTPTFYLVVARFGYDGGIQISASHNPKEWNGFKLVGLHGRAIGFKQGLGTVHSMIETDQLPPKAAVGGTEYHKPELVAQAQQEQIAELLRDHSAIKPFKIVFDGGNGMGGTDMKALFTELPCTVIWMNEEPDGAFPAHPADPMVPDNTRDLRARVVAERADIGIASDGDGDRYFFFDETGAVVPQEIVRGIMAKLELEKQPGNAIVYDVRPGKITRDMIEEAGGRAIVAPVGHSLIKEKMLDEDAIFGGESSGHFFYKLPSGTFEAPLVLVYTFLKFLSAKDAPLSQIVAPYRRYVNSGEVNARLKSREQGVAIIDALKQKYVDGVQSTLDGLSVEYPDVWFNVRLSNTEPLIRFIVESDGPETMAKRRDEIRAFIETAAA